jgi:hypothetical protein
MLVSNIQMTDTLIFSHFHINHYISTNKKSHVLFLCAALNMRKQGKIP